MVPAPLASTATPTSQVACVCTWLVACNTIAHAPWQHNATTGGWDGGQAEFLRVPFADTNLLKVPSGPPDRDLLLLSDVLATAWHANELAEVGEGDVVAIWGAGPVGALAAQCAFARGASRVVVLEKEAYRLEQLRKHVPRVEPIDTTQDRGIDRLRELTGHGPDCAIEAVRVY